MRRLLLLLLALVTIQMMQPLEDTCSGFCGRRPLASSHSLPIVGGIDTLPGTWPWMVSIRTPFKSGYQHTCGGSLITAKWILTAAHCFKETSYLTNWELVFGTSKLSQPGPDAEVRFPKRVVQHESYQPSQQINDIALVELDDPVRCNDYIQPACLPDSSVDISTMTHCYIAGWGFMREKARAPSDILKEAKVDLISTERCNSSNWYFGSISSSNLCAGFEGGGIDTCQGDSGGPLMCRENRSERYWVVGVTGWGLGCARAQKPGVYTSTQTFYDWIQGHTKEELAENTSLSQLQLGATLSSTAPPHQGESNPTGLMEEQSPPPFQATPLPETAFQSEATSETTMQNQDPPPAQPLPINLMRNPWPILQTQAPSTAEMPSLTEAQQQENTTNSPTTSSLSSTTTAETNPTTTTSTAPTTTTVPQIPRPKPKRRTKTITLGSYYGYSGDLKWPAHWPFHRPKSQTNLRGARSPFARLRALP